MTNNTQGPLFNAKRIAVVSIIILLIALYVALGYVWVCVWREMQ